MSGIKTGGFEEWVRGADRELRSLASAIAKARVPRYCTSDTRPVPARLAPGTPLFETNTNRTIYVNAARTGFVLGNGTAV